MRPSDAFALLTSVRLRPVLLGMPRVKSDGEVGYQVAAQEPVGGSDAPDDARVALALDTVMLSLGSTVEGPPVAKRGTPAPNVVGMEIELAMSEVTRIGLIVVVFQPRVPVESLAVLEQQPRPGAPVERFREVALWLDEQ
jgi:hypothetical protein